MYNVPIVDVKFGTPTSAFLRLWNQQVAVNVEVSELQVFVAALLADVANIQDVDIVAGTGLDGGGNISGPADVTLNLEDTAVTPGTYGGATNSPQLTVDQQGRITEVVDIAISSGGSALLVTGEEGPGPEFISNNEGIPVEV